MAINLGDVNFGVGADLTNLQRSVRQLEQFGRSVDRAQGAIDGLGNALRRQEKAAGDAFVKVQNMTAAMARIKGSEQYINASNAAFTRFNQTMTSGRLTALEMQRAQERLKVSLANTQNSFRDFSSEARRASAGAGGLVDGLRNLQASAVILTGPLGGIATRISAFTSITKAAGFSMAAFAAGGVTMAAALFKIGVEANRAGAAMKGWQSGLAAVTGSQTEAAKEIKFATQATRDAGTQLGSSISAWTKFAAAAEGTALQGEKAQKIFATFSKAATTLNISADDTAGIFKALEQMISKGTVQAEELRGQLGDRLPGAFQLAARAMGVTTSKLGDLMKKGLVPSIELLPKLEAELRRTLNIPVGPIETYAASLGRMRTAYEQLMISIDQKFDITGKVAAAADAITMALDYVRTNLDDIIAKIAVFGSLALSVFGGFAGAAGIGLAIAAINKFGDEIVVFEGRAGTLRSYMLTLWADISSIIDSGSDAAFGKMVANFQKNLPKLEQQASELGVMIASGMEYARSAIDNVLNQIINGMVAAWNGLAALFPKLPAAIADGVISAMNGMISVVNSGLAGVLSAVNAVINGINSIGGAVGISSLPIEIDFKIPEITNKFAGAGAEAGQAFDKAWAESVAAPTDYMKEVNDSLKRVNTQIDGYVDGVARRADILGAEAAINKTAEQTAKNLKYWETERANEVDRRKRLEENMARYGKDDGGGGGAKAAKALERRKQAIADIEEAITRVDEEIAALGGSEAGLKALNEEFKRRDEVDKYAKALRKAGVDAEFVKQKTDELYAKLMERDALKMAQQGMQEWSDALSKSVDWFGESLVDLAFEGKDAFKSIGEAAKNLAKDLVNTFVQLSLTNPLKNLLFGQANATMPTVGGGAGGILSKLFGSLVGGLGGGGTSYFPPAPVGMFRNGGVSNFKFGEYQKAANGLVTKPTFLNTPMGPVQAGEAGTEAIMPLERNSSGALGVRASVPNSGNVVVNVYAPEGSKVNKKQSSNSSGDSIIDIFIQQAKQAIAGDIASGGTAMNKAMEGRYGLAASAGLKK